MLKEKISLKRLVGLSQEDGQEIDTKSWTTTYEKAAEIEDDIRNDKFIESHWDGLYERVVKQ